MRTHNIPFSIENHPKLTQICSYGIFSKGLKNEFETARVNEPSGFEPLKFYCIVHVEGDKFPFEGACDKQNHTLMVISYENYEPR